MLRSELMELRARAGRMRAHPTHAEAHLWSVVRRGLLGAKFRRQYVLVPFIVDFYVKDHALAVEMDGEVHDDPNQRAQDDARDSYIEATHTVRTIRFTNAEVRWATEDVCARIRLELARTGS